MTNDEFHKKLDRSKEAISLDHEMRARPNVASRIVEELFIEPEQQE